MPTTEITDILERPLSRLPTVFRDKEEIRQLIEIFVEELFELQSVFLDLSTRLDLNSMPAYWLDNIGRVLDESRDGDDDDAYRIRLQMKIFFNSSSGAAEYITEALRFLTGGTNIQLTDAGLANLNAITDGSNLSNDTLDQVRKVLPTTVLLNLSSSFDGVDFVTVDVEPGAPNTFTDPDSLIDQYDYYEDPSGGKWWQDYKELTTADITIDSAVIGAKHSVFLNRNFAEFTSTTASTTDAATGLAARINAICPGITATPVGAVITVTGAAFTLYAISQNTTMNPAWLSEQGGVMVDILERGFPEQDTFTNIDASEGLAPADSNILQDTLWNANGAAQNAQFIDSNTVQFDSLNSESTNITTIIGSGIPGHVGEAFDITIHTDASGGVSDRITIKAFTSTLDSVGPINLDPDGTGPDVGGGLKAYTVFIDMTSTTGNLTKVEFGQTGSNLTIIDSIVYV